MININEGFAAKFVTLGGLRPIVSQRGFHPMPETELQRIETEIGCPLPAEYREFLKECGGVAFGKLVSFRGIQPPPSASSSKLEPFGCFYGTENEESHGLLRTMRIYRERIPVTLIPIGENMFGDKICLGIKGGDREKIFFWDHEDERNEQDYTDLYGSGKLVPREWLFGNIYLAAETFEDFLNRLEPDPGS
jgi:hypothetical protein